MSRVDSVGGACLGCAGNGNTAGASTKGKSMTNATATAAELTVGRLVRMTPDEIEVVRELVLREAAKAKQQGRKDRWEFLGGVIEGFNRGLHPERYEG